jgi:hypothetical protein
MKLPPNSLFFILPALFAAGLFIALFFLHGQPEAPGPVFFQSPS